MNRFPAYLAPFSLGSPASPTRVGSIDVHPRRRQSRICARLTRLTSFTRRTAPKRFVSHCSPADATSRQFTNRGCARYRDKSLSGLFDGGKGNFGNKRPGGRGNGGGSNRDGDRGDSEFDSRYLLSGAIAYEVSGALRRNYSLNESGEMATTHVNAKETHGRFLEEIRLFFLPEGFPESVGSSYAAYTFWRCIQNVITSMTAVLSTQALLSAVGIGPGASRSVAAATSWVLKDGFGSIGKLITARMGVAFDSESKRYRLASDILFDLGISLELITPLFPNQFLALAAMGNFVKSVSITVGMACRNSVLATFVLKENLGDISAKSDAQNTVANLTGLGLGIAIARVLPETTSVRLASFWGFTSIYSLLNYQSMKAVTLRTLNRQRAAIVIDAFLRNQPIPSPSFTNRHEKIVPFLKRRFSDPNLRFGAPLSCLEDGMESMLQTAQRQRKRFIMEVNPNSVDVVLHRDASSDDLLEAYLAYCHLRRTFLDGLNGGRCRGVNTFDERRTRCVPTSRRIWSEYDPVARYKALQESKKFAHKNLNRLKSLLQEAGYSTRTLLLAPNRLRAVY